MTSLAEREYFVPDAAFVNRVACPARLRGAASPPGGRAATASRSLSPRRTDEQATARVSGGLGRQQAGGRLPGHDRRLHHSLLAPGGRLLSHHHQLMLPCEATCCRPPRF